MLFSNILSARQIWQKDIFINVLISITFLIDFFSVCSSRRDKERNQKLTKVSKRPDFFFLSPESSFFSLIEFSFLTNSFLRNVIQYSSTRLVQLIVRRLTYYTAAVRGRSGHSSLVKFSTYDMIRSPCLNLTCTGITNIGE